MSKPVVILSAIRIGEANLRDRHAALKALWRQFGLSVRSDRRERKYSQKAFAIDLGVSSTMLAMMESGVRTWPSQRAEKAVQLLKRPEQWPDAGRAP